MKFVPDLNQLVTFGCRCQHPYMGITAVWVTRDGLVASKTLAVEPFPPPHTADRYAEVLRRVLSEWGIEDDDIQFVGTDNTSTMVALVRMLPWDRIPCACHWLQLSVSDILGLRGQEKKDEALQPTYKEDYVGAVADIYAKVRRCTAYFHRSDKAVDRLVNIQVRMSPTKKPLRPIGDMPVRWNTTLDMGVRYMELWPAIEAYVVEHMDGPTPDWLLDTRERQILQQSNGVLERIRERTDRWQARDKCTFCKVYPALVELLEELHDKTQGQQPPEGDQQGQGVQGLEQHQQEQAVQGKPQGPPTVKEVIKELKAKLRRNLERRWGPQGPFAAQARTIKVAAAVDPRNLTHGLLKGKWVSLAPEIEAMVMRRAEVIISAIQADPQLEETAIGRGLSAYRQGASRVSAYPGDLPLREQAPHHQPAVAIQQDDEEEMGSGPIDYYAEGRATAAASASSQGAAMNLAQAMDMLRESLRGELALYFDPGMAAVSPTEDPVAWWQQKVTKYPVLSKLAVLLLSVPASTAEVERLFSTAGFIVDELRTALGQHRVNKIVTLKRNWSDRLLQLTAEQQAHVEGRGDRIREGQRNAKRARIAAAVAATHDQPPPSDEVEVVGVRSVNEVLGRML